MVAYLGHSSLNPELSQFIVPKLIWPSSGTFQHHHQLSTSEDTASCLLGRLYTHQRASLCGQLEFVSRTSLITHWSNELNLTADALLLSCLASPSFGCVCMRSNSSLYVFVCMIHTAVVNICIYYYVYVCMYVCMYVSMYVCMYVYMYVCMYAYLLNCT